MTFKEVEDYVKEQNNMVNTVFNAVKLLLEMVKSCLFIINFVLEIYFIIGFIRGWILPRQIIMFVIVFLVEIYALSYCERTLIEKSIVNTKIKILGEAIERLDSARELSDWEKRTIIVNQLYPIMGLVMNQSDKAQDKEQEN